MSSAWPSPGSRPAASPSPRPLEDQLAGEGISLAEDLVGAVGLVAAMRADVRTR